MRKCLLNFRFKSLKTTGGKFNRNMNNPCPTSTKTKICKLPSLSTIVWKRCPKTIKTSETWEMSETTKMMFSELHGQIWSRLPTNRRRRKTSKIFLAFKFRRKFKTASEVRWLWLSLIRILIQEEIKLTLWARLLYLIMPIRILVREGMESIKMMTWCQLLRLGAVLESHYHHFHLLLRLKTTIAANHSSCLIQLRSWVVCLIIETLTELTSQLHLTQRKEVTNNLTLTN